MLYRQEIDGLRAIAIIAIVLSHFKEFNFVSGGVNIFFVISGYLITQIFLKQKLDLYKFYKTRFLKLYPPIFFVASISFLFFIFFGNFSEFSLIKNSFFSTLLGTLNFYLISIGSIYSNNEINFFLPFWAFCVILQFYLIFPFILKIFISIKKKFYFSDFTISIFILFFSLILFSLYFLNRYSLYFDFYSPLSRYWQFLLGSSFFFLVKSKKNNYFNNLAIYSGLILILIWQLDFEWVNSWRKTQLVTTIACLFFLYSTKANIIHRILSDEKITYIGRSSFPIYFIHMPVIYFVDLWFGKGVFLISIIFIVIIVYLYNKKLISIFETFQDIYFNKKIILFILSICLISSNLIFFSNVNLKESKFAYNSLFSKFNYHLKYIDIFSKKYENTNLATQYLVRGNLSNKTCHNHEINENFLENCSFNINNSNKNFFLLGGSQISALSYDLRNRLKEFQYFHLTSSNFIYLNDFHKIDIKYNKKDLDFFERNKFIKELISSTNQDSIVLIGSRFPLYLNKSFFDSLEGDKEPNIWSLELEHRKDPSIKWEDNFRNSINEMLKNKNIKIIFIYPIPEVGFNISARLLGNKFFSVDRLDTSYKVYQDRVKSSFELLDSIENDNIYRVYPHKLFCDTFKKDRCVTFNDNKIFYSDDDHLSKYGSQMLNDLIIKKIEKMALKSY